MKESEQLYKALVRGRGLDLLFDKGQASVSQHIEEHLASQVRAGRSQRSVSATPSSGVVVSGNGGPMDYKAAAQAFEEGSKIPGAHPWMRIMAAIMAQHGGEIQTARYLWEHIYESTTDTMIKDNAVRHLAALRVDEEVGYLQALVRQFQENTGKHPTDWFQMISAGYLRRLPTDPTGKPYKLMPHGRVEVQDPDFRRIPGKIFDVPADRGPEIEPLFGPLGTGRRANLALFSS